MEKIVYRDGIPCKLVKDGYRVTTWESRTYDTQMPAVGVKGGFIDLSVLRGPKGGWKGTGQRDVRVSRRLLAIPLDYEAGRSNFPCVDNSTIASRNGHDIKLDIDIEDLEAKAERSRRKSQQRAKRECRHKIKHGGFRHLLTGTYRENMTDFNRIHADFAAWVRRMKTVVPGFRYVYAIEPQKRGAWHWHCTIDSLPRFLRYKGEKRLSYDVVSLVWQAVVGDVAYPFVGPLLSGTDWPVVMVNGGTVNVDGHVRKQKKKQHADKKAFSLAKMADYCSKYLTKDLEEGLRGRKMWGSAQDLTPPKAVTLEFGEVPLADIIAIAFQVPMGHQVARHWINGFGDCWVLDTEPIPV